MTQQEPEKRRQRHRSRAEADRVVAAFEASGLSRQEFCEKNGVALKSLARYLARDRRERAGRPEPQRWVAVEVAEQRSRGVEFTVVLATGRRIEVRSGFDANTLAKLVTVLERV